MTSIAIREVNKQFGDFQALSNINLDINDGELVALLGPSGCGKTTLLRIIAGLENPDSGAILFGGQDTTHVHVRERHVGFVFQHYALFRHMTVFENIAFGLRVKPKNEQLTETQIQKKVHDLLDLVQLNTLANRFPAQLSGGQRQRVALARALAVDPKVLLLDEPFGALDAKVRKELRRWLRRLHDELHIATIFVTHDQEEALEVADRVVVMNKGSIEQVGAPNEVWEEPASPFVYEFLGDVNAFHGRLNAGEMQINLNGQITTIPAPDHPVARSVDAAAYVRPHDCDIERDVHNASGFQARLSRIINIGPITRLEFEIPKGRSTAEEKIIEVQIPAARQIENRYAVGETLLIVPQKVRIFT